jgi:predicted site-specific integrase-resolvase
MKTIKQIADGLGIDKQRVYRYIRKNHISDVHHDAGVMWYDDVAETTIIQYFTSIDHIGDVHNDVHQTTSSDTVIDTVIAMLQKELDIKNRQIEELTAALEHTTASLHAAQALHAGTMQKQLTESDADRETPQEQKGFFSRLFKGKVGTS